MGECITMTNDIYKITWNKINQNTFMYGSNLSFHPNYTVFENELMPSGLPIHEWLMLTEYSRDKEAPQLPLLKRQQTYHFKFDYSASPEQSIYFILIFYSKNGEEVQRHIIKEYQASVQFPDTAYSYKIVMMNAGVKRLEFRYLMIQEYEQVQDNDMSMVVSDVFNAINMENYANIILIEPTTFNHESIYRYVAHLNNVIAIDRWWQGNISTNIGKILDYFAPLAHKYDLHFIGYGPKSNVMAQIIGNMLKCKTYRTVSEDQSILSEINKELIANNVITEDTTVYHPRHRHTNVPGYLVDFINPAIALYELDVAMLNCGGGDLV